MIGRVAMLVRQLCFVVHPQVWQFKCQMVCCNPKGHKLLKGILIRGMAWFGNPPSVSDYDTNFDSCSSCATWFAYGSETLLLSPSIGSKPAQNKLLYQAVGHAATCDDKSVLEDQSGTAIGCRVIEHRKGSR